MVVETGFVGDGFAWILGRARKLECLGAMEGRCVSYFAGFLAVGLLHWIREGC